MKAILVLTAVFMTNWVANANTREGMPEPVTVVDIRQEGDLMPPVTRNPITTTLKIRVGSGGCTKAEDFDIQIDRQPLAQSVTIVRNRKDLCEAFVPNGAEVELSVNTLGLSSRLPIRVENPLFVIENVTH